jgi:hypothetical protein
VAETAIFITHIHALTPYHQSLFTLGCGSIVRRVLFRSSLAAIESTKNGCAPLIIYIILYTIAESSSYLQIILHPILQPASLFFCCCWNDINFRRFLLLLCCERTQMMRLARFSLVDADGNVIAH